MSEILDGDLEDYFRVAQDMKWTLNNMDVLNSQIHSMESHIIEFTKDMDRLKEKLKEEDSHYNYLFDRRRELERKFLGRNLQMSVD